MSNDIAIRANPEVKRAFLLGILIFSIPLSIGIYRFSLSSYFDVKFIEVRLKRLDAPEENLFYKFKDKVTPGLSTRRRGDIVRKSGVNIFQRNVFGRLKFFATDISPNAKYIIIKKLFPCKVIIYVFERSPQLLVNTRNGVLMVDSDFVILPTTKETLTRIKKENRILPFVVGLEQEFKNLKSGYRLNSSRLKAAKEVLDLFNKPPLSRYFMVEKINPSQLGRVSVFLSDRTEVILNEAVLGADTDNILTIFSELRKNNIKPRYIDLRFKEPVIGIR